MKKSTPFSLIAIFTLLATLPLSAKEFLEVGKLIDQSASATVEKYPDSDDVLLDDFTQVEYQADGTSETWGDTAIKVLTEKGKRDNRTLSLSFNTSYGTNYFTQVQLIKPDGTVHEIDIGLQSKVMVDPSQMSANIYNPNSKILKLSIPGLEIGDTLRYVAHQIKTKTVVPDAWSDYQVFEFASPIEHTTYQVIAPKDRPLVKTALKAEIPGTVTFHKLTREQSNHIVYTWEVQDVPRMFDEPNMPSRHTVVQRLLVSTLPEWEDLSKWYWNLCLPRLEATTPEMQTKANALIEGHTNTLEKIEAIFNFVSQDIRYMGITTEEEAPGYEPHDAQTTFDNRYGVCRDKAALLASMLRLVDIEAFPVIIMAGPKKDEEVPQPFFNHAITAALGDNGEYVLMDSTDENTKDIFPSYLQDMSYLVARPEGETLLTSPIIPATENLLKITSIGSLDAKGQLTAQSTLAFEGINDTVYRGYFSKIKPEERQRFFEGHLKKSMPTAQLQSLEIRPKELRDTTQPLTIQLVYTADDLLIKGTELSMLDLPRLGKSLGYANFLIGKTGLQRRQYPLYTRMTAGIRETFELKLPKETGTPTLPHYQQTDTPQLTWNMRIAHAGTTLFTTNTFLLKTVEFNPKEYLQLKQNLQDSEYNLRKKIVFAHPTAAPGADSDVRILEKEKEIVLTNSTHWKETTRTKIKILTYAGTKKNSEIKITYNPAWQNIELTRATVTQPDGTQKEISAEELNTMDAGWVASAPRYPAEKILVANLPGVEVGSILEYEVVSTVRGKPFFSTTQIFNAHEPVDRKSFTLTAPDSLALKIRSTGIAETQTTNAAAISHVWIASNQPPVQVEESLPEWWTFNPAVFISSSDWKTYSRNVRHHLLAATEHQPETQKLAKQLVGNLTDETQKIIVLRDWVAKNIRPAGPALIDQPLSAITPADQTLSERYGNNPDRMAVLHTLLKSAGFQPRFILSGGIPLIPEAAEPLLAIPSRTAFGSVLIQLDTKAGLLYLDGASQYAQLGTTAYEHRPMLNLATGQIGTIKVATDKKTRKQSHFEITIADTGEMSLSENVDALGTAFETFHKTYAEMTPEKRRRHYAELVSAISQSARPTSDLITDYTTYPGRIEFSIVAKRFAVHDGDYLYFTLPAHLGDALKYRSNERTLPLAWNRYIDSTVDTLVHLPKGYEPAILPQDYAWKAPANAGGIEVSVDYNPLENTLHLLQRADLQPALIPASEFPNILRARRRIAHPDMRTILLKRKTGAE